MSGWGRDLACSETCSEISLWGPNYPKILKPGKAPAQRPSHSAEWRAHKNLLVPFLLGTLLVAVSKTTGLVMKCNLCCFSWQSALPLYGFNYSAGTQSAGAGMLGMMLPVDAGRQVVQGIQLLPSKLCCFNFVHTCEVEWIVLLSANSRISSLLSFWQARGFWFTRGAQTGTQ